MRIFLDALSCVILLLDALFYTHIAGLEEVPKLCKGSFSVSFSFSCDLINGLDHSPSTTFNRFAEDKIDGICSFSGTLVVGLANDVGNTSSECDSKTFAVATLFLRSYARISQA